MLLHQLPSDRQTLARVALQPELAIPDFDPAVRPARPFASLFEPGERTVAGAAVPRGFERLGGFQGCDQAGLVFYLANRRAEFQLIANTDSDGAAACLALILLTLLTALVCLSLAIVAGALLMAAMLVWLAGPLAIANRILEKQDI